MVWIWQGWLVWRLGIDLVSLGWPCLLACLLLLAKVDCDHVRGDDDNDQIEPGGGLVR